MSSDKPWDEGSKDDSDEEELDGFSIKESDEDLDEEDEDEDLGKKGNKPDDDEEDF
jgi:hypothetical protein